MSVRSTASKPTMDLGWMNLIKNEEEGEESDSSRLREKAKEDLAGETLALSDLD